MFACLVVNPHNLTSMLLSQVLFAQVWTKVNISVQVLQIFTSLARLHNAYSIVTCEQACLAFKLYNFYWANNNLDFTGLQYEQSWLEHAIQKFSYRYCKYIKNSYLVPFVSLKIFQNYKIRWSRLLAKDLFQMSPSKALPVSQFYFKCNNWSSLAESNQRGEIPVKLACQDFKQNFLRVTSYFSC